MTNIENDFKNMPWNNIQEDNTQINDATNTPKEEEKTIDTYNIPTQGSIDGTDVEIAELIDHITGKNENGEPASVIGYQFYALEDAEDPNVPVQIYNISKAYVEMYFDKTYPMFYDINFIFPTAEDMELKLMWGNLQRFKKNQITKMDKTWVFYINILGAKDVTIQTNKQDMLVNANVFNPIMFYLTRHVPNFLCQDNKSLDENEYYGGNVIKMLVPREFVTFNIRNDIDTLSMKGEVESEEMEKDYLNNMNNTQTQWNE